MKKVDIFKPTKKQLKFIRDIESVNGVKFTGQTRWDASDFISKHKDWFFMQVNMTRVVSYAPEPSVCVWDDGMAWERMESY